LLPASISRTIRAFGLSREVLVELLSHIHEGIPQDYEVSRHHRAQDVRYYKHRIVITTQDGGEHLFLVIVDDTTSPDHLHVAKIGHGVL
jgi:hypothetical protein